MCQEYIEGLVFRFLKKLTVKLIGVFKRQKKPDHKEIITEADSTPIEYNIENKTKNKDNQAIKNETSTCENTITETDKCKDIEDKNNETIAIVEEKEEEILEKDDEDSGDNLKTEIRHRKKQLNKIETKKNELETTTNTQQVTDISETNEDGNQNENRNKKKKDPVSHDAIHFHFSLFLLWFITAALNVPSVLTWARNFQ